MIRSLALFLVLGLGLVHFAHAEDENYYRDQELRECPVKGQISMRLDGTVQNGQLLGYIDNKFVSWMVIMGNIQGYYNGNFMTLKLEEIKFNELSLTGWIGSYRVNWRTFGGYFNERVDCR